MKGSIRRHHGDGLGQETVASGAPQLTLSAEERRCFDCHLVSPLRSYPYLRTADLRRRRWWRQPTRGHRRVVDTECSAGEVCQTARASSARAVAQTRTAATINVPTTNVDASREFATTSATAPQARSAKTTNVSHKAPRVRPIVTAQRGLQQRSLPTGTAPAATATVPWVRAPKRTMPHRAAVTRPAEPGLSCRADLRNSRHAEGSTQDRDASVRLAKRAVR